MTDTLIEQMTHTYNKPFWPIRSVVDLSFFQSISHFVNAAFENDDFEANLSFSDVVNKLIREPIKEDIHPYGRGNLYRSAFDGAQPKIHQDESKLFLWAVTTVVILGIAGAVIFMSCEFS